MHTKYVHTRTAVKTASTGAENAINIINKPFLWFLMALAYSHPVILCCKAAWQLKLTQYNAAPYRPKSGTIILGFGNEEKTCPELVTVSTVSYPYAPLFSADNIWTPDCFSLSLQHRLKI